MSMQLVSHVDEMSNAAMSCLGKVRPLRKTRKADGPRTVLVQGEQGVSKWV